MTVQTPVLSRARARAALTAGLSAMLALAAVAVAPAASAAATSLQIQAAVQQRMSGERAMHGEAPLRPNARLASSAAYHNGVMAARNQLSHQLYGEADLAVRITRTGYRWVAAGENIGYTTYNASTDLIKATVALEAAMYYERAPYDGHKRNILSRTFVDVGISVRIDATHHKVWLTVDFGRPA